jgi:NhaA family Na+:H+ antiporter
MQDGLMIPFFAYVGMELRSEFHDGALSDKRVILLPLNAAIGGMIIPALIYLLINLGNSYNYPGFAIPSATDIAFAICLFNMIYSHFPSSIRVFLLSVAVFDDLGAIIIIATCYLSDFKGLWLCLALPIGCVMFWMSRVKFCSIYLYLFCGILLCFCLEEAGIHSTLAGFITGFALPVKSRSDAPYIKPISENLHPYIYLFILPAFAFSTTGISLQGIKFEDLLNPLFLGIVLGLFIGKQVGISLFAYLTIKFGLAPLPDKSNFKHIYLVSILGGIGFTMSLFIGLSAFDQEQTRNLLKLAVLTGSLCSALFPFLLKMLKII